MDTVLLILAWAAGMAGLFLVADMIIADFRNRRLERMTVARPARPIDQRCRGDLRTSRPPR